MGSFGSDEVDTDQLSCGAKIRRIFQESLSEKVSQVQYDEDELRRMIAFATDNMYGINGVMNTPFPVLESVVKKQVGLLAEPVEACFELVIEELKNAVRRCTQRVSKQMSWFLFFFNHSDWGIIFFIQNIIN